MENLSVHYTGNMDGIVLSELFYNGGTYGGTMMHPDQYIVIANNSDREINVSGLALAQASNMNTLPCSDLTSLLPDYVVAANIYQIPAGQNYTLAPGRSLRHRFAGAEPHGKLHAQSGERHRHSGRPFGCRFRTRR